MRLLEREEIYLLLDDLKCPFCYKESDQNTWDKFKAHDNIFYGRCKLCDGRVKLIKRKVERFQDYRFCEFVFKDIHLQTNAVRGYKIARKTYEKNKAKLGAARLYSKLGVSEIDELMKNIFD